MPSPPPTTIFLHTFQNEEDVVSLSDSGAVLILANSQPLIISSPLDGGSDETVVRC